MVGMGFVTVICAILAIVMLCGKGSFLIAGYNTASKEDKEKYDEEKLCRVVGGGMAVIAVVSGLLMAFGSDSVIFTRIFVIALFAVIIAMLVLTNTCCYSEKYKANPQAFQKTKKLNSKVAIAIVAFVVIVGIFVFVVCETGNVTIQYNDDSFRADASFWTGETFNYDTIEEITYRTDVKVGSKSNGINSFRLNIGTFSNDEFGRYTLYSYVKCKEFVELKTSNGVVLINGQTPEDTKQIYEALSQKVKHK